MELREGLFERHERGVATTHARLSVRTACDPDAIPAALRRGVTAWVASTKAGRHAWHDSSHDLNIGDLACADPFAEPTFVACLAAQGLHEARLIDPVDPDHTCEYDFRLVDEDVLAPDDEDDA